VNTKFENKKRYSLAQILLRILAVNVLFFSNLITNRVVFGDIGTEGDMDGIAALYFFLYFLLVLALFVLSGFEIRLLNNDRKRALHIENKVDYFYKIGCFGMTLLIGFVSNNDKTAQLVFLITAFVLIVLFDMLIFLVYRKKIDKIVIDWTDSYRDKSKMQ
jgi:hypothetical protein